MFAMPSDAKLEASAYELDLSMPLLSSTTSGPDGSYRLPAVDVTPEFAAEYASPTGIVDVEIVTMSTAGSDAFSTSSRIVDGRLVRINDPAGESATAVYEGELLDPPAPPPSEPEEPVSDGVTPSEVHIVVYPSSLEEPVDLGGGPSLPNAANMLTNCSTRLLSGTSRDIKVVVNQSYSTVGGVRTDASYTVSAESAMGVAVSSSSAGPWKIEGSVTKTSDSTTDFSPTLHGNDRYYLTTYRFGKFRTGCVFPDGGSLVYYKIRAYAFPGGADKKGAATPSASYCSSSFNAGSAFTKNQSTAIRWLNGIALSDFYGIGIDAWIVSGYTTRVSLHYNFNQGGRRLCGTGGYVGDTPFQIVVKD